MSELRRCECGSLPVVVAMPYHESMIALECPHCGISTGFSEDRERTISGWNAGDVACYAKPLFDMDGEPMQLTFSETATVMAKELGTDE